jgi:hypothetical protein
VPYRLDGTGTDIHGEGAALRGRGPAARVLLPRDIPAWSVTDPGLIRRLTHPDVSKDAHQHWPAYINNEIPETWPLRIWVDVRGFAHELRQLLYIGLGGAQVHARVMFASFGSGSACAVGPR